MENGRILGSSPQAQLLQKLVQQAAPLSIPVLLAGEPGVGREFLARLLHQESKRPGPFLRLGCVGLSESVLQSELQQRLALANGGSLFLEHIEEAGLRTQADLARFVQTGGVRLIASTTVAGNDDRVIIGTFGIRIMIAPLRERRSDIPVLIDHFTREFAREHGESVRGVQPAALKKLMTYQWPGNTRELRDAVERAVMATSRKMLDLDDFSFLVSAEEERPLQFMIPGATIQDIEKEAILRTIEHAGGSTAAAARMLKMSVRKIQYKLKQYRMAEDAPPAGKAKAMSTT